MSAILRIGGIGTGRVFCDAHLPVYASRGDVQLTALYDPDNDAALEARLRYNQLRSQAFPDEKHSEVAICRSVDELLEQVDMVDICATVRWHAVYAALALHRGIHTMTEKPTARTWWEAHAVAESARQSQALFQLNDDNLFIPRYQALRHVVESGMIGEVQSIWIARGYSGSGRKAWFWDPVEAGGGCIMDYGSHAVASTWFLLGLDWQPVEVRSLGIGVKNRTRPIGGRLQPIEIDDDAHFKVRYLNPKTGDWATVIIEATWTWPDLGEEGSDVRGYIEIEGSLGTVTGFVDEHDQDFLRVTRRSFGERLLPVESAHTEEASFQDEIANFIESVRANQPSILNAEVAENVIKIINCAQLSELRGRVSVTPQDLETFSREIAAGIADPQQAGDEIVKRLNEPYRWER